MTHEEFARGRMKGLGGTDHGAILCFEDAFKTPYDVWRSKLEYIEGEDSPKMRAGRLLEPIICEMFKQDTGYEIDRDNLFYTHKDYPFLIGNVDGIIKPKDDDDGYGVLEIKNVERYIMKEWVTEVKLSYWAQLQHYLYVTGLKWGYFALFINGWELKPIRYERDDKYLDSVIPKLIDFWENNVLKGIPPEITTLSDAKQAYRDSIKDSIIEADDDAIQYLSAYKDLEKRIKELGKQQDDYKLKLQKTLQDKEILVLDDKPVLNWKKNKNGVRVFKPIN